MASGCIHKEALFLFLFDLDHVSFLLDKYNDLEKIMTHLFGEVNIFSLKFEKKHNLSGSKYTQNMYRNLG